MTDLGAADVDEAGPVRVSRSLRSPRDEVWTAWTDADGLGAWFWPPTFATEVALGAQSG